MLRQIKKRIAVTQSSKNRATECEERRKQLEMREEEERKKKSERNFSNKSAMKKIKWESEEKETLDRKLKQERGDEKTMGAKRKESEERYR